MRMCVASVWVLRKEAWCPCVCSHRVFSAKAVVEDCFLPWVAKKRTVACMLFVLGLRISGFSV